jgi:glycosyltransferase involved in cell wall biosynthesis
MVKHLRLMGHHVVVVCSKAFGEQNAAGVIRTPDVLAHPGLRRLLGRPSLSDGAAARSPERRDASLPARVLVPDVTVASWLPSALHVVRRVLANQPIDCLITTSPSESAHLIGLALGRSRPAWVAELRDGWTFERSRGEFPFRAQRALDRWLEAQVVTRSDKVVAVTRPIAADISARFGVKPRWVPNAWDPELEASIDSSAERDGGRITFVHTGRLSGNWGRDPRPLFEALRMLVDGRPDLRSRLSVILAGRLDRREERLIHDSRIEDVVELPGQLSRLRALALQRRADALLLVSSPHTSEATGKLSEYLAAGRPIVALAAMNEAERIIRETRTGIAVAPDDLTALHEALLAAATGRLRYEPYPEAIARYLYPAPAAALADEADAAIAVRAERAA